MKRMVGLFAAAALVMVLGAGCGLFSNDEPADKMPVPGALDDPNGNYTGLGAGGSGTGLGAGADGKWVAGADGALGDADKDGWVKADPSGNRLGMPIIYFAYDSDMLVPSETAKLDAIAAYLTGKDQLALVIEGHCDQRGTEEYNRALGERRANVIREYLAGKGLGDQRMKTISFGKDKPAVDGNGEAVWRQNRRGVPEPMIMPAK